MAVLWDRLFRVGSSSGVTLPGEPLLRASGGGTQFLMAHLLVVDPMDLVLRANDGSVRWRTRDCFERELRGIPGVSFSVTPAEDPDLCRKALSADGVILGGSERAAWEDSVFNDHLLDMIAICRHNDIPLLAICFGAQLLGRALGGHVAPHPQGLELGAPLIRLTKRGKEHFLFNGIDSDHIRSVATHADAVLTLPPDCELLASSEHTPVQAFNFRGLLTGVQFHPEMDGGDLRLLWEAFEREKLVPSITEEQQRILDTCRCEPVATAFKNFAGRLKASAVWTS